MNFNKLPVVFIMFFSLCFYGLTTQDRKDVFNYFLLKDRFLPKYPYVIKLADNDYEFISKIGAGAEGDVYRVKRVNININNQPHQEYAVKIYRHAETEKMLDHNKAKKLLFPSQRGDWLIFDKISEEGSQHYLNMPIEINLDEGWTLFPLMNKPLLNNATEKEQFANKTKLFWNKANEYLTGTYGIYCGDIKAENVMLDKDQFLKIVDLGACVQR